VTVQGKMQSVSVLIVDDQKYVCDTTRMICRQLFKKISEHLNVQCAYTKEEALKFANNEQFHLILLDQDLGKDPHGKKIYGIDLIPTLRSLQTFAEIIMLTATNDIRSVVEAMKRGASDYLVKVDGNTEYRNLKLTQALNRAYRYITRERQLLSRKKSKFICKSPPMRRVDTQLQALAKVDDCVLITGASGLGKQAGAERLSELRGEFLKQVGRPFVDCNTASLSKDLFLTELFGAGANAFTGAANVAKPGLFESADGGDLFLDEIGEIPEEVQKALLKVIDQKIYTRVGAGEVSRKSNVRVIMATNRDLKAMVKQGLFRHDLYMRISAFKIEMPPLEERKEELSDIVNVLIESIWREYSQKPLSLEEFPSDLVEYLTRDNIEGNLRGIKNDLKQLLVFSQRDSDGLPILDGWRDTIRVQHSATARLNQSITFEHLLNLPTDMLSHPEFPGLRATKDILERKLLGEALEKYPDSLTERAHALKMAVPNASTKFSEFEKEKIKTAKEGQSGKEHAQYA